MSKPLDGIVVLETASFVSGPYVGQLLADLGADVIKIENPKGGDPFRHPNGYASEFQAYNPNKRSLALDITKPQGADILRRLIATADVLVHNFRPGVMERLGFGWENVSPLNQRLIYCSLTGFGHDGPYQHRPSYDSVAGALSGFLSQYVSVDDPQIVGPAVSDAITGLYASYGVLGALVERGRTGRGCRVDVTMVEAMIAFLRQPYASFFSSGVTPSPLERPSFSSCFALVCADGKMLAIHISSPPKFWEALLSVIPDCRLGSDPRFDTRAKRIENFVALTEELSKPFRFKTRAEWMALLDAADVPFAPINNFTEVMADPQVRHLGIFARYEHAERGTVDVIRPPLFMDGRRPVEGKAPPTLGEHTDETLRGAGIGDEEIKTLRLAGIVA
jgi:crotonobetainyl-CoA:carnitine CoA-transferase CaiB-like acyl-CoA transferase